MCFCSDLLKFTVRIPHSGSVSYLRWLMWWSWPQWLIIHVSFEIKHICGSWVPSVSCKAIIGPKVVICIVDMKAPSSYDYHCKEAFLFIISYHLCIHFSSQIIHFLTTYCMSYIYLTQEYIHKPSIMIELASTVAVASFPCASPSSNVTTVWAYQQHWCH